MAAEPPPETPAIDDFLGNRASGVWRQRLLWLLLGLVFLLLIALVGRFVNGGAPTRYASAPVLRQDLTASLHGSGTLQPLDSQLIGVDEPGRVAAVHVARGAPVKAGDLLASLDAVPVQVDFDRAAELLAGREATLATAKAAATQARAQMRRYEQVRVGSGGLAPSRREMRLAQTSLNDATRALADAEAEVAAARRALADQKARLAALEVRAPADGVVIAVPQVGQELTVGQNDAPFVLAAPYSRLKLEVLVNRTAASGVRVGATTAHVRAAGRGFPATVAAVRAARSTDPSSVILVLDVQNPSLALKPGLPVMATVQMGVHRDALVVPDAALQFARAGGPGAQSDAKTAGPREEEAVYVLGEGNRPRRVPVAVKGGDGANVAVASNELEPGMRIITGLR